MPREAWQQHEFVAGRDIFYTVNRQEIEESCFKQAVDIVFSSAAYRTVRPGQRLCRFLWDPRRCYLHRLTLDGKWLPALGREIREMLQVLPAQHQADTRARARAHTHTHTHTR